MAATEEVLEDRLAEAGFRRVDVARRGVDRLVVQLTGPGQLDPVLLEPGELEFTRVDEDWDAGRLATLVSAMQAPPASVASAPQRGVLYTEAGHAAGLLHTDRLLRWSADDPDGLVLHATPFLDNGHVQRARAGEDDWGTPYVQLWFTP